MATNKSIITQAALEPIKAWEAEIAENLIFHANTSLSKAHGWEYVSLTHPFIVNGNDVSVYQDSNGDLVGTAQMRLSFNNINYYAPLNASTEPGQPPITGIEFSASAAQGQGGSAWVTDFSTESQAHLIATNTQLLLPHTLRSHWEAHTGGVYTVRPQPVSDSAGHLVGRHVAVIVYKGQQLLIPCDSRLGGPPQLMRLQPGSITTKLGTNFNTCSMGADDNQFGYMYYLPPIGGTLPYTFKWQIKAEPSIGAWNDIPLIPTSGNTPTEVGGSFLINSTNIRFTVNQGNDDSRLQMTVRGAYTNEAGTAYSNWCQFYANDTDGCWIFSGPETNQNAWYAPIPGSPP